MFRLLQIKPLQVLTKIRRKTNSVEKETLIKLLSNISSKKEIEYYLKKYTSTKPYQFAIIKIGGSVIHNHLETLASSLSFIHNIGLYPIVVHGGGPQLNQLLKQANIEPQYHEGIRITDEKTLEIARQVFQQENTKLINSLQEKGLKVRSFINGVFMADFLDKDKYQYVGTITDVNTDIIKSCIYSGALPILSSLAQASEGQILNVNADVAASSLAKKIKPLKVIYLNDTGPMRNPETKEEIKEININTDFEHLLKQSWVKFGTKLKLLEIKDILDHLPSSSSVSVTSVFDLQQELFTSKGTGTLVKKGYNINFTQDLQRLDKDKLQKMFMDNSIDINEANRWASEEKCDYFYTDDLSFFAVVECLTPKNVAPYLTSNVSNNNKFIEENLVKDTYIVDKMIVTKDAIYSDILDKLFDKIKMQYKQLAWIVHMKNKELDWHFNNSDANLKLGEKVIFLHGCESVEDKVKLLTLFKELNCPISFYSPKNEKSLNVKYSNKANIRRFSTNAGAQDMKKRLDQFNIGLIGARGYTGQELVSLIDSHPNFNLKHISSRELAGQELEGYKKKELIYERITPESINNITDVDAWILALPNKLAKNFSDPLEYTNSKIVLDLSADYRFDSNWWYGLSELYPIENSKALKGQILKISNPGCYATGMQLGLFPLISSLEKFVNIADISIAAFGISGYSGAGTTPSDKNDLANLKDNIIPYALTRHIHEKEVSYHLNAKVNFVPHVGEYFRGISLTLIISSLNPISNLGIGVTKVTSKTLAELYQQFYMKHPLIKVQESVPLVRDNMKMHFVTIGGFGIDLKTNKIVIIVTLDNLLKGAATQAIQNLNAGFGLDNTAGIPFY